MANAGITAYLFELTMTLGLRRVKAAPAAAMAYLTAVWGTASGIVVFGEVPTVLSVLGALIICAGTLAVIVSDSFPGFTMKHPYMLLHKSRSPEKNSSLDLSQPEENVESTALSAGRCRSVELAAHNTDMSVGREPWHSTA